MSRLVSYTFCLLVAGLVLYAFSPRHDGVVDDAQLNLSRVQINDMLELGTRLVAVGERGTIAVSEDNGRHWTITHTDEQTPETLTGISAISKDVLLAVGHDSVILRSADGGYSWTQVMRDSKLGEPLFDSWSGNGQRVFVFGSFGKFYVSDDAGKTFHKQKLPIKWRHLYSMSGNHRGTEILVGERGLVMRSQDGGDSWKKLDAFYDGSLFGVAHMNGSRWIAYGMRGHVFYSQDNGDHWASVDVPGELPLYGASVSRNRHEIAMVGAGGSYVTVSDHGKLLGSGTLGALGTLTSAVFLPDDELFVAGQGGFRQGARNLVAASN